MIGNFPAVLNFDRLFLKLYRFICNQLPVLRDHRTGPSLNLDVGSPCSLTGGWYELGPRWQQATDMIHVSSGGWLIGWKSEGGCTLWGIVFGDTSVHPLTASNFSSSTDHYLALSKMHAHYLRYLGVPHIICKRAKPNRLLLRSCVGVHKL